MFNKYVSCMLISGFVFAFNTTKANAKSAVVLEKVQKPELELSLSKDIFKTSHPAIYNLTLDNADKNSLVPVKIKLTKPSLLNGATEDPKGTKLRAYVSFTDSLGKEKTLSSDDETITAILKPGVTKLTLIMEADRPKQYHGGSYDYNFTLTVKPIEAP